MLRSAALVVVAYGAAGCWDEGEMIAVQVSGSVEIAPGCARGADRFGVALSASGQQLEVTLHCADTGAFSLAFVGGPTATLTITAVGCDTDEMDALLLGKATLTVDTSSGFADVGVLRLRLDDCP
jgi:hypothetical protein